MTYLEKQIKDEEWLKVMKNVFKTCHKKMPQHSLEIQKQLNFTKAQCDIKYEVMFHCIGEETFIVSLKLRTY
jgi:hypothetical protein